MFSCPGCNSPIFNISLFLLLLDDIDIICVNDLTNVYLIFLNVVDIYMLL